MKYLLTKEQYLILESILNGYKEIANNILVYHSTDIKNAINILNDGEIKTYENKLKDCGQNPEDWYDDPNYGKFVYVSDFIHNENNYYGLSDLDVTFVIDTKELKSKIYQADRNYEGGTIAINGNVPLKSIKKVLLHNNDDTLINLLSNKNIEYEILNTNENLLKENNETDVKLATAWYPGYIGRIYSDINKAKEDIIGAIKHYNKQYSTLFGEYDPAAIIKLFDFITMKNGVKVIGKVKLPKQNTKKEYTFETDTDLVCKQKNLWSEFHGIEFGRYLSKLQYFDTKDKRIYGTEKLDEEQVLKIMKKLKEGIEFPPILLDYDFGILDGHHRYEAAKKLNIKKIPVIIYEYPDNI